MNDGKYATLEVIAPTVEEAIAQGLAELGLSREDIEVEVLDRGRRGLLGVGTRQVRVRIIIKSTGGSQPQETPKPAETAYIIQDQVKQRPLETEPDISLKGAGEEITLHVAQETAMELLEKMGVVADVTVSYQPSEEAGNQHTLKIDITGKDLSILIGRRVETLQALQYITSLIVCKKLGRSVHLHLDVEGYRERRKQQLLQMAQRMAEQAIITGRRQILEPMPADKRRLIHLELRDHPTVYTESIGEEPRRKVTIVPKA